MLGWMRTGLRIRWRWRICMGLARLAWNPDLSSEEIADEWTRLTFGNDAVVDRTIDGMLLALVASV